MKYFDYLTPAERWDAAAEFPVEFLTAARIMSEYVAAGDKLLDLNGDVGRFGMYFADMGCNVTLADRSCPAIELAEAKASAASTKIAFVNGGLCDVADVDFDFVIARFRDGDISELLCDLALKTTDEGMVALWVTTPAYDMQKLLGFSPENLPDDLVPSDSNDLFVDIKRIKQAICDNGFTVLRTFAPTSILTGVDRELVRSSDDTFIRLMDLAISACDTDAVISASASVIFICNKTK